MSGSPVRTPVGARSVNAMPCWWTTTLRTSMSPCPTWATAWRRIDGAVSAPAEGQLGLFTVRDSLLSEYAAVGFEYGYSVEAPEALVAWEAQFGDFANGAQIIIDNFLAAAEIKWGQYAGLVMLLPHGYEGQGPEHSSSRFERFLALCARGNMRVAVPSTSAQYFHLLRSQALLAPKRPLIVVTPKSMLRAQASRSPIEDLESGILRPRPGRFRSGGPRHRATHRAVQREDRPRSGAASPRDRGRRRRRRRPRLPLSGWSSSIRGLWPS